MPPAFLLRLVALACALTSALLAAEKDASTLRLIAEIDGVAIELKDFGTLRFRGEGPSGPQAVPFDAPLHIEGDLAANGRFIFWEPTCYLLRAPLRDSLAAQPRPWFGYMRIVNGGFWAGPSFSSVWKENLPNPAVAIFAWMHRGRIVHTAARKLPANPRGEDFRVHHVFPLSEAEAGGFGVILLWSRGRFIAATPAFRDSAVAAVFHDMMLGRTDTLEAGLALGKKSPVAQKAGALLNHAAISGLGEAVSVLLRHGVRPDDPAALFMLETTARRGRSAILEQLLEHKRIFKNPRWFELLLSWGHDDIVRRLLARLPADERVLRIAVEQALAHGFADLARDLLRRSSWDATEHRRNAELLLRQIKLGYVAAARLVLERKADPNHAVDGMTLLGEAALSGAIELVDALLRAGAKPNTPDARGSTPLLYACMRGDIAMARRLIEAGADPKYQRKDGITPLHLAAVHAAPELARLLLAAGADPRAGATRPNALEFALLAHAPETAAALSAAGLGIELQRPGREHVLAAAVRLDAHKIVDDALARGWKPDKPSSLPWPLETYANIAGATRVSALLAARRGAEPALPGLPIIPASELDAPLRQLRAPTLDDTRQGRVPSSPATVELKVIVDEKGLVYCPRILRSDDGRLSFTALQTASQWQFHPPTKSGRPVCTEAILTVAFAPSRQAVFDLSEVDSPPMRITYIDPYIGTFVDLNPSLRRLTAHELAFENSPRLRFTVTTDAHPEHGHILNTVEPREQRAMLEALNTWTYAPAMRDGKPVAASMELSFSR